MVTGRPCVGLPVTGLDLPVPRTMGATMLLMTRGRVFSSQQCHPTDQPLSFYLLVTHAESLFGVLSGLALVAGIAYIVMAEIHKEK